MKRQERYDYILRYFLENYPAPETELIYHDPYSLLVAVVLSAQCTDKRVNMVTPALLERFPTPAALGVSTPEEIFPYIRSISYPNNKAKHLAGLGQRLTEHFGGEVPANIDDLQTLPGVGRKTANVIASVVYNQPTFAVDTHVYRVSRRISLAPLTATTPLAVEKQLLKYVPVELVPRAHHWLIFHGRYVCLARTPKCTTCPIIEVCAYAQMLVTKGLPLPDEPSVKRSSTKKAAKS